MYGLSMRVVKSPGATKAAALARSRAVPPIARSPPSSSSPPAAPAIATPPTASAAMTVPVMSAPFSLSFMGSNVRPTPEMTLRKLLARCPPLGRSLLEREQCLEHRGRRLAGAAHERVDVAPLDGLHEHDPLAIDVPPERLDDSLRRPQPPGRLSGEGDRPAHVVDVVPHAAPAHADADRPPGRVAQPGIPQPVGDGPRALSASRARSPGRACGHSTARPRAGETGAAASRREDGPRARGPQPPGSQSRTVALRPPSAISARPPWASAMALTIARPSPVPPRVRAASPRAKRSKARSARSESKPGPWSATSSSTPPFSSLRRARSTISPAPWRSALSTRLPSAWRRRRSSASTRSPSPPSTVSSRPCSRARSANRALPLGGPRDDQQVLGELCQVVALLERRHERLPHLLVVTARAQGRLQLGPDHRHGRA